MKGIIYLLSMFVVSMFLFLIEQNVVNKHVEYFFKTTQTHQETKIATLLDRITVQQDDQIDSFNNIPLQTKASTKCNKTENVVFLKTHKTGSSTITSILNRYADLYDLTMLLPAYPYNRFLYPNKFQATFIEKEFFQFNKKSNMLVNHARMNKPEMDKVMMPNTKYITIIRNPVTQFESAFYYFELDKLLGLSTLPDPISGFFANPVKYYKKMIGMKALDHFGLLRNGMLFDLGLDNTIVTTARDVDDTIQKVEEEFDLVLITEYFDESLILMMRTFCWTFDDILYLKQNSRTNKRNKISPRNVEVLKKWNQGDYKLYQTFNQTFWRKIEEQGDSFWDDLKEFKARKESVTKLCGFVKYNRKSHNSDVDIHHFRISYVNALLIPFCKKLLTGETDYIKYFRKKYHRSDPRRSMISQQHSRFA